MPIQESKRMDRHALRRFLDTIPFCGCGCPEEAAGALYDVLSLFPLYENQQGLAERLPDVGYRYLFLYMLDGYEITEHGGNVAGGWLTDKGKAVMAALNRERGDDFEALFADHCVHGYDVTDEDHDCMKAE